MAVTNAVGSVFDPGTWECIAGPRGDDGEFVTIPEALARRTAQMDALMQNTTLICVATNATLEPHQLQRVAAHAHTTGSGGRWSRRIRAETGISRSRSRWGSSR